MSTLQAWHLPHLASSADSLYITHLAKNQKLLIIANDSVNAKRMQEEVAFFSPELKCTIFPDTEILPYERTTPQKDIIAKRLKMLWQLHENILDVAIISSNTLMSRVCPKEYLYQRQFNLKIGESINLQHLTERLVASDYTMTAQVCEAGEFAKRGGIIDIIGNLGIFSLC